MSKRYQHFDFGILDHAQELPNGFVQLPARFSRVGIFEYRNPDGTSRRELRLPSEVFKADALRSFASLPVTNDHPIEGRVTSDNASKYAKGFTSETIVQDGEYVAGSVTIFDKALIHDVRNGKRQLSNGYDADLERKPGIVDSSMGLGEEWIGKSFDVIQRNIRGNHAAIVMKGRAGPGAAVRLDADDAVLVDASDAVVKPETGVRKMATLHIDGVPFECPDQTAQAFSKALEASKLRVDAADKAASEAKATADAARADAVSARKDCANEKARADAAEASINERVNARTALTVAAAKYLPAVKCDAMTDRQIQCAIVAKLDGETIADNESVDYVRALYTSAVKRADKGSPNLDAARVTLTPGIVPQAAPHLDAKSAKLAMEDRNRKAASEPIDGAVSKS